MLSNKKMEFVKESFVELIVRLGRCVGGHLVGGQAVINESAGAHRAATLASSITVTQVAVLKGGEGAIGQSTTANIWRNTLAIKTTSAVE